MKLIHDKCIKSKIDTGGASERERAREAALTLLDHQDRTSSEMTDRLVKKGFERSLAEEVTGSLQEAGLIDDRKYALLFTESKISAGKGSQWIKTRLLQKGLDRNIIDESLDEAGVSESEDERCLKTALGLSGLAGEYYVSEGELLPFSEDTDGIRLDFFDRKISAFESDRNKIKKIRESEKQKLARKLISRGFQPGMAFSAVKKIDQL